LTLARDDDIVVVRGRGRAKERYVYPLTVPTGLRGRLGEPASAALAEMMYGAMQRAVDVAVERATDRFERRLAEELAKLRVEMAAMRVDVRSDLNGLRAELLKWSFLFWTGQVVAIAGLMALMR
jgi:hypothetical protein